ncbi:MAG: hypothetical protein ABEH35_03485 [Haloarculaceae archaeon]
MAGSAGPAMVAGVEIGLDLVAGNPNLTFIFFIALVLLAVLGFRFGLYAFLNRQQSDLDDQRRIWSRLVVVGALAAVFAGLGLLEIVTSIRAPYKQGLMVGLVVALTLSLRTLYYSAVPSGSTDGDGTLLAGVGGVAAVVVFVGIAVVGPHPALTALAGIGTILFAVYGVLFGRRGAAATRVQGTVVDTLLRHLLPVLLFAAMVPVVALAVLAGLDRAVVLHVQVVFIIMTATSLMTATIKLRQNLAGL